MEVELRRSLNESSRMLEIWGSCGKVEVYLLLLRDAGGLGTPCNMDAELWEKKRL